MKVAMTRLVYLLDEQSPYGNPELTLDLETAPGYMLFFSCFMGDIDLVLDGVEFRTNFGWVPTLSFAIAFHGVVDKLPIEGKSRVDFQEDPTWISFQRSLDRVHVSCSYSSSEQTVAYEDLLKLSRIGLRNLLDILYLRFPALERNQTLRDSLRQVGLV